MVAVEVKKNQVGLFDRCWLPTGSAVGTAKGYFTKPSGSKIWLIKLDSGVSRHHCPIGDVKVFSKFLPYEILVTRESKLDVASGVCLEIPPDSTL